MTPMATNSDKILAVLIPSIHHFNFFKHLHLPKEQKIDDHKNRQVCDQF